MNKLRLLSFTLLLVALGFSSCKKKSDDNVGANAYTGLKVYVLDTEGAAVNDASVTLYASKEDRDAGNNSLNAGLTKGEGLAYFSNIDSRTYYVFVIKDLGSGVNKTGKGDTVVPIKSQDETGITIIIE